MEFQFAIVEFVKSQSVGTIPKSWIWIDDDNVSKCYYPPDRKFFKSLSTHLESPDIKWKTHECRILAGVGKDTIFLFS